MNKENKDKLWKIIQKAGTSKGKLPAHLIILKKIPMRISLCIKEKFNLSYKDIPDDKLTSYRLY